MSESAEFNKEAEIEDGKNKRKVKCQYCKSIILNSQAASYVNLEVSHKKRDKIKKLAD